VSYNSVQPRTAMTPERWQQVDQLYHSALEREPGQRSPFLVEACAGDEELRREVESLLAQEGSTLDRPAWEGAADLLDDRARTQLVLGTQLGPYRVEAALGAGGMGEVYRAVDTRLKRTVAIKIAKENFGERFEREARAIAALNHPNICTLHDVGPNYLVMELIEGPTLAERIKQGPVPLEEALGIARQIADALEAAHEKGVVHRDLKPGNVKIKPDGIVKVLDFGLATQSIAREGEETTETMTAPGTILGTVAYMSPEQAQGKPVDKRADIWAFGVVLYEMLTGRRMFQGETVSDTLAAVLTKEPEWERVSAKVQRLLKRCLEKDPQKRLRDISGVGLLLEETPQGMAQRHSRVPWAVAAALAVGLLGVSWIAWRATRPVDRPLMRFSADLGPEAVEGPRITAAISPDDTRLAFVARGPGGKEQLATRLLAQAKATLLPGTENAADPFFSPDGQWIGFFADGKMKKISVQGGAAVTLCDTQAARGASWGEDGSIIVTPNAGRGVGLFRVPEAGGTPQAITKPSDKGEATHRWPQILPGGQAVLFTGNTVITGHDDANIDVLSLKRGQWKMVQRGGYFPRYLASSNGAGHLVYIHQGTLFAVGFDLDRLEVRGTPVPVLEDVAGNAATGGGQFDVARNGTLVYLSGKSSNARWPVAWMDSTGKTKLLLAAPGQYYTPRFSADGNRLALAVRSAGGDDIQVYDWQRDTMTRLTFTQRSTHPVWTPDAKHIAFEFQSPGGYSIRWARADGAGEAQPLLESKGELRPYSFSPDGKRLSYTEQAVDTGWDLWTLPVDVSDPEHPKPGRPGIFLRTQFDELEPAFSPDGRWITYTSNESGGIEVYVRPFPGGTASGSGKWQISTGGGLHPIWSRNGRELFYETPDDHIMVAAYTASADSFAANKPRPWSNTQILQPGAFQNWVLDLAPDGKRFAVFPRPESTGEQKGSVHVTVLLNFFDELRRSVPLGGK
jgi:Tol biopolymer transport system component/predicted Ser/Thr protein kinase